MFKVEGLSDFLKKDSFDLKKDRSTIDTFFGVDGSVLKIFYEGENSKLKLKSSLIQDGKLISDDLLKFKIAKNLESKGIEYTSLDVGKIIILMKTVYSIGELKETISYKIPSFQDIISKNPKILTLPSTISDHPNGTLTESPDINKVAITFDICSCYKDQKEKAVINSLDLIARNNTYPVTIFVAGGPFDNPRIKEKLIEVAKLPHVSIQPHGLNHHAVTSKNAGPFFKTKDFDGIPGTGNIEEAYNEIALSAKRVYEITGRPPKYFRSPTLYTDPRVCKMLEYMGMKMVGRHDDQPNNPELHARFQSDDGGGGKKGAVEEMNIKKGVIFLGHAINYSGVKAVYEKLKKDKINTTFI